MTFADLIEVMRMDYLSDVFEGWEDATEDEKSNNFLWQDRQLLRMLNEAHRQACQRADVSVEDAEFNFDTSIGKSKYVLSQLISQLNHATILLNPSKELIKISRSDLSYNFPDYLTAVGTPSHYYVKGYNLFLYPVPDSVNSINLETNSFPEESAVGDDPIIPLTQHIDLIWYALSQAYSMQDADAYGKDRIKFYMDKFDSAFGPPVSNAVIRHQLENVQSASYIGGIDYINSSGTRSTQDEWNN